MAELPESTLDTRIAERIESLLARELAHLLPGGVEIFEEEQLIQVSSLKAPLIAIVLASFGDRVLEQEHRTGLLIGLITRVRKARSQSPPAEKRFFRFRMGLLIERLIFTAADEGQLVAPEDARYAYALTTFEQPQPYYLGQERTHLLTPMRLVIQTHRQLFEDLS